MKESRDDKFMPTELEKEAYQISRISSNIHAARLMLQEGHLEKYLESTFNRFQDERLSQEISNNCRMILEDWINRQLRDLSEKIITPLEIETVMEAAELVKDIEVTDKDLE